VAILTQQSLKKCKSIKRKEDEKSIRSYNHFVDFVFLNFEPISLLGATEFSPDTLLGEVTIALVFVAFCKVDETVVNVAFIDDMNIVLAKNGSCAMVEFDCFVYV
jgi:hypothetical protein